MQKALHFVQIETKTGDTFLENYVNTNNIGYAILLL